MNRLETKPQRAGKSNTNSAELFSLSALGNQPFLSICLIEDSCSGRMVTCRFGEGCVAALLHTATAQCHWHPLAQPLH